MDDVISRQAAIEKILGQTGFKTKHELMHWVKNGWLAGIEEALDTIEDLPAVDAVPVVRCRDCRFATWYTAVDGVKRCFCDSHGSAGHTEKDFCSYAEREEMD